MLTESQLRPYQLLMAQQVLDVPKCGLWSFMGSGKTVSVLTAIRTMMLSGSIQRPTLVVAPLRVAKHVWPKEVHKWEHLDHLRVSPVVGHGHHREAALLRPADIYTINYENFVWLAEYYRYGWPFGLVVLDEATKVKSLRASIRKNDQGTEWVQGQGGQRAKEILRTLHRFGTERVVELSGTPAPNGLKDLWGQIFLLDYGKRLGRVYDAFKERWFETDFNGWGMQPKVGAQQQIERQLKDICLSLRANDWFDVREPILHTIKVELPPEARTAYRKMEKELFTQVKGHNIEAFNAGAMTQKLLQLASGFAYKDAAESAPRDFVNVHELKLDALEEIVEEWAGQPILVSYQHRADLERICARFKQARPLDQKTKTLEDWDAGKIPILVAHPGSAGHGLNLQVGSNVLVYYSSGWNYEEDAQIAERIGPVRQAQSGFKRPVFHYRIVVSDTIEEEVLDRLQTKCSINESLMKAMSRRG